LGCPPGPAKGQFHLPTQHRVDDGGKLYALTGRTREESLIERRNYAWVSGKDGPVHITNITRGQKDGNFYIAEPEDDGNKPAYVCGSQMRERGGVRPQGEPPCPRLTYGVDSRGESTPE